MGQEIACCDSSPDARSKRRPKKYDLKVVVLGAINVGKTKLAKALCTNKSQRMAQSQGTINAIRHIREEPVVYGNDRCTITLIDVAGNLGAQQQV